MCGITGIWRWDNTSVRRSILKQFTSALKHRGPDGEGLYVADNDHLGLGHRRLAILDPTEGGHQPISFANKRYWLTYNGEIFNFVELRQRLRKRGYHFKSDCDSEVILAAYDYWGVDCLQQFNGMWAFAIWDRQKKQLFLARDRYGIKPLHYANLKPGIAFASETYAFGILKNFDKEFDARKLTKCIYEPRALEGSGHTIYKNIYQLLPGHYIQLSKGGPLQQQCWWNWPDPSQTANVSYKEQVDCFKSIFIDSCKIRMRSDVPIASALSGGLDSSSVYSTIHHLKQTQNLDNRAPKAWQKAFVASFPGTTLDETNFAKEVVRHTNGEVEYIEPHRSGALRGWLTSTVKFDAISRSPNFTVGSLYKAMHRKGFKVSLDGHGPDEMMFGYPAMVGRAQAVADRHHNIALRNELAIVLSAMSNANSNIKSKKIRNHLKHFAKVSGLTNLIRKLVSNTQQHKIRAKLTGRPVSAPRDWLNQPPEIELQNLSNNRRTLEGYNCYEQIILENFYQVTLPKILANFDRASMQHGIEIRMPFMDWRLVKHTFSLPLPFKIGDGYTKRILRDAMKGILPEVVRKRTKKIGFTTPMNKWFGGELAEPLLDFVHSRDFLESSIWNGKKIGNFIENRIKNDSWTRKEGVEVWPFINAYILMNKNR